MSYPSVFVVIVGGLSKDSDSIVQLNVHIGVIIGVVVAVVVVFVVVLVVVVILFKRRSRPRLTTQILKYLS